MDEHGTTPAAPQEDGQVCASTRRGFLGRAGKGLAAVLAGAGFVGLARKVEAACCGYAYCPGCRWRSSTAYCCPVYSGGSYCGSICRRYRFACPPGVQCPNSP